VKCAAAILSRLYSERDALQEAAFTGAAARQLGGVCGDALGFPSGGKQVCDDVARTTAATRAAKLSGRDVSIVESMLRVAAAANQPIDAIGYSEDRKWFRRGFVSGSYRFSVETYDDHKVRSGS
jgi:hypothetical protein